ncbi:hypothetical protein VNO78_23552 [Psophocarpus tetragonolobus]|uniref:Uncharacterized protein n=1 Tax=Psophocarpus tetragonolobus TaxID=3891 RepID=A0AAN9XDW5_PSOTE
MHIPGKQQWQSYAILICCCLGHSIMGMAVSAHGVQSYTIHFHFLFYDPIPIAENDVIQDPDDSQVAREERPRRITRAPTHLTDYVVMQHKGGRKGNSVIRKRLGNDWKSFLVKHSLFPDSSNSFELCKAKREAIFKVATPPKITTAILTNEPNDLRSMPSNAYASSSSYTQFLKIDTVSSAVKG